MKTLTKEQLIEKLKEIIMHVGFGTDTPTDNLITELKNNGCSHCLKLANELETLEFELTEKEVKTEDEILKASKILRMCLKRSGTRVGNETFQDIVYAMLEFASQFQQSVTDEVKEILKNRFEMTFKAAHRMFPLSFPKLPKNILEFIVSDFIKESEQYLQ